MTLISQETWRPVKGYESFYEVSDLGRVRSLSRTIVKKNGVKQNKVGKLLKPCKSGNGYYYVVLTKNSHSKSKRIHILVAKAFIPNPENYQQVNHLDGDKSNNKLSNLEWCTPHQNQYHAVTTGLFHNPVILQFKGGKLIGAYHSTRDAAKATGLDCRAIGRCANHDNEHRHVGGYAFVKANEFCGRPLNEEEE